MEISIIDPEHKKLHFNMVDPTSTTRVYGSNFFQQSKNVIKSIQNHHMRTFIDANFFKKCDYQYSFLKEAFIVNTLRF